jgi:GT2 family glycosyltransferase
MPAGTAQSTIDAPESPHERPNVVCVIVNWNGAEHTIRCLDALRQIAYPGLAIVVVDNGSADDSVQRIRAVHPKTTLIEAGKNLGFAGGNNIGIRKALAGKAQYIWLLNNDTVPDPAALAALVRKAGTDPQIGAVASVCYHADAPSTVQAWAGARVNLWTGYGRITTVPRPDRWFHSIYGASALISAAALRDVGLLDEGFFHYWEESELSLRLLKRGWLLAAAPDSRVLHKVASSSGKRNPILDRYFTASGLRILHLHSPAPRVAMTLFLCARFMHRILRGQFSRCRSVFEGIEDYRRMRPVIPRIT